VFPPSTNTALPHLLCSVHAGPSTSSTMNHRGRALSRCRLLLRWWRLPKSTTTITSGRLTSAPPSSSELPHPQATGLEVALKSPATIDSNRTHNSHLPNQSTPFLCRLSNWTPVSTPASTAPLRTGSSGEHLPALSPKMGSPQCRTPP
jgi:hypothetical protein